jgi:ABC-type sugar transport system permease subunit
MTSILWIRRDLRLTHNAALHSTRRRERGRFSRSLSWTLSWQIHRLPLTIVHGFLVGALIMTGVTVSVFVKIYNHPIVIQMRGDNPPPAPVAAGD